MAELSDSVARPTLELVRGVRIGRAMLSPALPEDGAQALRLRALATIQRLSNEALSVSPSLRYDEEQDRLRLVATPKHLLAAMWLQFALSIDTQAQFRRCAFPECPTWFAVEPASGRSDKRFCSDTCRAKFSYRQRKAGEK